MAAIGAIIIIAAVTASVAAGIYAYDQNRESIVYAAAGQPVQVGPVSYTVYFAGTHDGYGREAPEHGYIVISISATNTGEKQTRISNGQFTITGKDGQKTLPEYANFTSTDLSGQQLEPGLRYEFTTQFDAKYAESERYDVQIRPTKEQSSRDIGIVCLQNC